MDKFRTFLEKESLSPNTVESYLWTVNFFLRNYTEFTTESLLTYKGYLVDNYKPQTVNLRIQGINKYLEFCGLENLKLKFVKMQQRNFLENVISDADYRFLKKKLKDDGFTEWYFVIWYMAATGVRVSELVKIKVEHVECGYLDIYSKGGKVRRLYIPKHLAEETMEWLDTEGIRNGYIFKNKYGNVLTTRGIALRLRHFAKKYGLDTAVVHPHSFRHRFAKNWLHKNTDIALLADIMGHESIETTRIYLRRTATEQQDMVNSIVDW